MPRPQTTMTNQVFIHFASTVANYYAPLFGTPAAEVAHQIAVRFNDGYKIRLNPGEPCPAGMNLIPAPGEEYGSENSFAEPERGTGVSEEIIERNGLDELAEDSLETLKQGIKDGYYPEGSVTRTIVDYMIHNLEAFQRRELAFSDHIITNGNEFPGIDIASKTANYEFIPLLSTTVNPRDQGGDEQGNGGRSG